MVRRAGLCVAAVAATALICGAVSGGARGKKVKVVWPQMSQATQHGSVHYFGEGFAIKGPPEEAKTWTQALGGREHGYLYLKDPLVVSYRPPEYTASGKVLREAEVVRGEERREAGWCSVKVGGSLAAIMGTEFGWQPVGAVVQLNPEWEWPCKLEGSTGKVVLKAKGAVAYLDGMEAFVPISKGFRVTCSLGSPKEGSHVALTKGGVLPVLGVAVREVKTQKGETQTRTGYIIVSEE